MNIRTNTNSIHNIDETAFERTLLDATMAAAKVTLPAFRSGLSVDNKLEQGFDPVTQADKEAELVIRQTIEQAFPDHMIIGEEHATKQSDSPFSWIIDPIDGTRAFITGVPVWGTLIGIAHEEKTFAGIMTQPFTGETFLGLGGKSTYSRFGSDPKPLSTSAVEKLSEARLMTTTPALFEGKQLQAYLNLENQVRLARYGCDCYAYCLLAAGEIDLVVEAGLNIYDIAALIPIIKNAGGVITTFDGSPADKGGNVIAAATPELHQAAMNMMAKAE
ncbi:Histidinol-phosphatase [alternative form] [hydrothermal vent metagenome]|uniref:histidinol-phosphatase n=1 Tax=hydrothermal vent metagenome TaxID=652676 RepID=A0A3B0T8R4_9ZZZZ